MKTHLTKAGLLLTGLLVGGKLFAQTADTTKAATSDYVQPFSPDDSFRTWSVGVNGGLMTPFTIFGKKSSQDFRSPHSKIGYGAYIKKQITSGFALQANFMGGQLAGADGQPDGSGNTYDSYETKLHYAISLNANLTVGNISFRHNQNFIQPYATIGIGGLNYTPVVTVNGTSQNVGPNGSSVSEWFVPVGGGFKINVSKGINIDLGYQVNFAYADNLDGYRFGAHNDRFSYAHAGLEFALGSKSKPQLAAHNPVSSMRTEYMMENRNTRAQLQGQIDAQKAANDQLKADLATTNANLAKFTTDSDNDGVPDFYDKCPNTPAGTKVDGSGCPLPVPPPVKQVTVITEADRKVVKDAIANLEFDFGKATIREHSYPSLERVANLLVNKNFSLKLAGHTDNVGSDDANMKLSKDRAESVKAFLVSKGANASRIEATGYGETQPIASNKTAKGRQQNRRVEFTLF